MCPKVGFIEAWASLKSFKKKDADAESPPDNPNNSTVKFHGGKRSNETHESTTDPAVEAPHRVQRMQSPRDRPVVA
jgi:hypothetical protein